MKKLPQKPGTAPAQKGDVNRFLAAASAAPPPVPAKKGTAQRLIFAMDATASRAPTWDMACSLHAEIFDAVRGSAGISVQLVFFRGARELRHSRWNATPEALLRAMSSVRCRGGITQIVRVIEHAGRETAKTPVRALVLVGDSFEEDPTLAAAAAGRLAVYNVPMFLLQEGNDARAGAVFRELAHISGGAHLPFHPGSAAQLRGLLRAVATYAASGRQGLSRELANPAAERLLAQLR